MQTHKKGLSHRGMLICGMSLAILGILGRAIGRGILQDLNPEAVEAAMQQPGMAALSTLVLFLEILAVAAVPMFSLLMVEAAAEGADLKKGMIGLGLLAVVSEIPYNLLNVGTAFGLIQQNPVFGLLLCTAVLWLCTRAPQSGSMANVTWILAFLGASVLCFFLRIEYGLPLLVCTAVMWGCRNRTTSKMMAYVLAAAVCVLLSPTYVGAPIGVLAINFYTGEHSDRKYLPVYVAYPAALLIGYLLTFLF